LSTVIVYSVVTTCDNNYAAFAQCDHHTVWCEEEDWKLPISSKVPLTKLMLGNNIIANQTVQYRQVENNNILNASIRSQCHREKLNIANECHCTDNSIIK